MKSFMVTQLDAARTRMLDDVFSKDSTQEQRLRGMRELIKLMTFTWLAHIYVGHRYGKREGTK